MYAPTPPILCIFFLLYLLFTPVFPIQDVKNFEAKYKSFNSSIESKKMKLINDLLKKINKPFVKSIKVIYLESSMLLFIQKFSTCLRFFDYMFVNFMLNQSPDGDIIDCVLIHLQPAFDLPQLKGTFPMVYFSFGHIYKKSELKTYILQPISNLSYCFFFIS